MQENLSTLRNAGGVIIVIGKHHYKRCLITIVLSSGTFELAQNLRMAAFLDDPKSTAQDSTNGTQHQGYADNTGSTGRHKFLNQLHPLLAKKSRSVDWDKSAEESVRSTPAGEEKKLPTTPHPQRYNPLNANSENVTIASKMIEQIDEHASGSV